MFIYWLNSLPAYFKLKIILKKFDMKKEDILQGKPFMYLNDRNAYKVVECQLFRKSGKNWILFGEIDHQQNGILVSFEMVLNVLGGDFKSEHQVYIVADKCKAVVV